MTSRRTAWAVPAVTAGVVVAAVLAPSASAAGPHPKLPARTAAQLLVDLQSSTVRALSGSVVETARLGLPSLPGTDRSASLGWTSLVTGTHTAQVWLDGPERQRVALLGQLAESDVVHNGRDVWTYSSEAKAVTHGLLPAETRSAVPGAGAVAHPHEVAAYTPAGVAQEALRAIDPTTQVTVDPTARVAGQAAYTLVLQPRDSRSTVRRVTIAIDAAHHVPLRVQVFGAAAKPAFEIGFATISFRRPAASVFRFRAPKGATVSEDLASAFMGASRSAKHGPAPAKTSPRAAAPTSPGKPTVIGSGWTSVVELPAGGASAMGGPSGLDGLFSRMTTPLPSGDRLLRTALVNVVTTADGRTFVGAVDAATLEGIASGTHA